MANSIQGASSAVRKANSEFEDTMFAQRFGSDKIASIKCEWNNDIGIRSHAGLRMSLDLYERKPQGNFHSRSSTNGGRRAIIEQ